MTSLTPVWVAMLWMGFMAEAAFPQIADKPENVRPLLIGAKLAMDAPLWTVDNERTALPEVVRDRPTILVFFRGGWCPWCDLQLSELRLIEADLKALGYQIVAVSTDPPAALRARGEKNELSYRLLSDHTAALIKAFGIAFAVDEKTAARFNAVTGANQQGSPMPRVLPVPAVYIVDQTGTVQFQYVNPDYRIRLPKDLLLVAARTSLPSNR